MSAEVQILSFNLLRPVLTCPVVSFWYQFLLGLPIIGTEAQHLTLHDVLSDHTPIAVPDDELAATLLA